MWPSLWLRQSFFELRLRVAPRNPQLRQVLTGIRTGEVLGEGARRARALLADIALHGRVESIATNDLVKMGRGNLPRLNERIESLDTQS